MPSIKKSVRINDETIKLCEELTLTGEANFSGSINSIAQQFKIFIKDNMPELTDNEKTAFYSVYNGYIPHPDINEEIKTLSWHISEGYQYDQSVKELIGSEDAAIQLIDRIKQWSISEKLSVIYMAKAFWRTK